MLNSLRSLQVRLPKFCDDEIIRRLRFALNSHIASRDMTGKLLDSGSTGALILIIPLALTALILVKAWPVILALIVLGIALRLWQHYQWKQWNKQVNPFFNQLLQENQGRLTPVDLSMKANLTGGAAQRFLDKKAEEYGAQRKVYQNQGNVYYFLTASALGSLFEDSAPLAEEEEEAEQALESSTVEQHEESDTSEAEPVTEQMTEPAEPPTEIPNRSESEPSSTPYDTQVAEPTLAEKNSKLGIFSQEQTQQEEDGSHASDEAQSTHLSLIQADLAKRLEVHSSTVGKRKSDPDFAEWSQSRDPEGVAWKYSQKKKTFVPKESEHD